MQYEHRKWLELLDMDLGYKIALTSPAGVDFLSKEEFIRDYNADEKGYMFYDKNGQPVEIKGRDLFFQKVIDNGVKIYNGKGNWDIYCYLEGDYEFNKNIFYSIAKEGSGADDSYFGDLEHLKSLARQFPSKEYDAMLREAKNYLNLIERYSSMSSTEIEASRTLIQQTLAKRSIKVGEALGFRTKGDIGILDERFEDWEKHHKQNVDGTERFWFGLKDKLQPIDEYISKIKQSSEYKTYLKKDTFVDDQEKMVDFALLTKDQFLASYSYHTEEEYDKTKEYIDVFEEDIAQAAGKIAKLADLASATNPTQHKTQG